MSFKDANIFTFLYLVYLFLIVASPEDAKNCLSKSFVVYFVRSEQWNCSK
jgi:hypothetical protein